MTKLDEYNRDMEKVWSAIVLVGSIALAGILMLIIHLVGVLR